MPTPGHFWWHIILNTHGSWLHGDPRGFRSRGHRIHSSGDYKHRPPEGEHAALHAFHRERSTDAVKLKPPLFSVVGDSILAKARARNHRVLAISVDAHHAHLLAELPAQTHTQVNAIAARWKQASSHAVRDALSGRVWCAGGRPSAVRDPSHQQSVYRYILKHRAEGAWVWSYSDEE